MGLGGGPGESGGAGVGPEAPGGTCDEGCHRVEDVVDGHEFLRWR